MTRAVVALLLVACVEPAVDLRPIRRRSTPTEETDPRAPSASPADETSSPPATPAVDAGPSITPWSEAAAFALTTPPDETKFHHDGADHAGEDCMGCHTGQGAPKFAIAGTIYKRSGGEAATGTQVRVVTKAGDELFFAGTDSSGNFWVKSNEAIPEGALVGIRDKVSTRTMAASITVGACNQSKCHTSARPIVLAD